MNTDVLIVGAGPTGLMLANQLVRRGIGVTIVDRHSGAAQQTRAMAVHARTLEIYSKLGIADRALDLGKRGNGANLWANGRLAAHIPLRDMGEGQSPYPFVLMLGQDDNERIMGEKLRTLGVSVQWDTELVGLDQQIDGATARLKDKTGAVRTMRVAYVAGCDGSRSSVREFSNIAFPGASYEHTFFVADTVATGPMVQGELNAYLWKDGFHLFFPMSGPDRWRVIGILPKRLRSRDDVTFDEVSPAVASEAGAGLEFKSCSWFSTYRIQHRCVERFRDRRAFLLGDAAHVHSPMGGQGMNTGLQDAYNLAWKLALVVKGEADERLLDTYESERMPVAHELLESTDRAFTMVVSDSWLAALFRTKIIANVAAFAMKQRRVRARAFRTISQIGIRYPASALSRNATGYLKDGPQAGERFPWLQIEFDAEHGPEDLFERLDDTAFNLLVIGQAPIAIEAGGMPIRTVTIPHSAHNDAALERIGIDGPAFYLVRPDGHIALAGSRLDADMVKDYLSHVGIYTDGDSESRPVESSLCR
jgi:2-polyprenyl-6-methoxyphenol hydroxylase-like FAD-dependent oxidoreductase